MVLVLEKTRFAVLAYPCSITLTGGSRVVDLSLQSKLTHWVPIVNVLDWQVHVVDCTPPIHEVALGKPPALHPVSCCTLTMLQRQAKCGFRDLGVPYLNKLLRLMPKNHLKAKPRTVIEKVCALCAWVFPDEQDLSSMVAQRIVKAPVTKPIIKYGTTLPDEILDSTDKKELQSEETKADSQAAIDHL